MTCRPAFPLPPVNTTLFPFPEAAIANDVWEIVLKRKVEEEVLTQPALRRASVLYM